MRSNSHYLIFVVCLAAVQLAVATGPAAEPANDPATAPPTTTAADRHDATIKDVYKDHFLIGMAGDLPGNYSDAEKKLVIDNFNIVTPENCLKPAPVHPSEETWRFDRPDALVNWCREHKLAVHGHTLVWHAQTNDWFFRDGDRTTVTRRLEDSYQHARGPLQGKNSKLGCRQRSDQRSRRRDDGSDGKPEKLVLAADNRSGIRDNGIQVCPSSRPGRETVL